MRFLPFLLVAIFLTVAFFAGANRYVYLATQHVAYKAGFNINSIAKDQYVSFIKSQMTQANTADSGTLGVNDNKSIEIDLSEQRLYMKDGANVVNSFSVSTGKWAPTPTGEWRIWTKLKSSTMTGGSKALGTYYNLPNVPYTMYYNQGYGIHGAYWHNNFGQPMSHGCTNMKPEEAKIVYDWSEVGTRVIVHD